MSINLTCPVCDRPDVEGDICPNCETNLSTFRILAELQIVEPNDDISSKTKIWLLATIFAAFAVGIIFGATGEYLLFKQPPIATNIPTPAINTPVKLVKSELVYPCIDKYYYTVRKGEYLSGIALKLYGDTEKIQLIIQDNPQLKGREDDVEIGEKLLITKLYPSCN